MSSDLGYYRHPTIAGERIVFVSEDDLWSASPEGGTARRLTANPGVSTFPVLSPDGKSVAFTGRDDGPAEVYVMDAEGGPPKRLTWMGSNTQVVGWTPDGENILAATDWRQPFAGMMHLVAVPESGGSPVAQNYGPARAISFGFEPGGTVIGRNSGDPARWKRYRGGTAGTLWVDRGNKGNFSPLIQLKGNLASPMWIGNRIYFLSDHEGNGNLYSCTRTGRGLKRHTNHKDFYVRFPKTDGSLIVYHAGTDIYVFDPARDVSRKVDIRIRSTQSQHNRKFVSPERYRESFDLHPKGHTLASVHRGGLFSMGLWTGAPVRLGTVSGVRYRLGSWLPDGEHIVAVTDEGGEEALIVFRSNSGGKPKLVKLIKGDLGRPIDLYVAPGNAIKKPDSDSSKKETKKSKKKERPKPEIKKLVLTNHRHEIVFVDLDSGRSRVLDRSRYHRINGVAWSPDSNWIAYGHSSGEHTSAIRLLKLDTGKIVTITREDFSDGYPSFDPDGKYLYFVSGRIYNPVYDNLYFDLGFPMGTRPYLVTLGRETPSPFARGTEKPRAPGGTPGAGGDEAKDEKDEFRIDLENIEDRVVAFPLPEGRYGGILGARGRALYSKYPIVGSLSDNIDTDPHSRGILEYWSFDNNKSGRVSDKVSDFSLSLDARVLGILSGNRVRAVPAEFKDDSEKNKDEYSRETGWVDLDRIPVSVVPREEWRQMYSEAWRLQKEHFWTPDMSGVDWEEVYRRYLPVLDRVGTRVEFSDLMWEMQGELGTSHCYEMGGDYRPRPNWRQGFLGADLDLNRRTGKWSVRRIPMGDSWDAEYASPLAAPGLNLRPGDEILAVGGEAVNAEVSPYERLVNMADQDVQITVRRRKGKRSTETVTVKTLREESSLRYRDWVEGNRRLVHERTDGRVGYIHIPDMGPFGYSEFHRYFGPESDRDGLIIDVRFNRGGHVSPLLLEKLVRKRIGYDVSRWSEPIPYPYASPMGPMVALTNEYAGSDGDIFSHSFKLFGLGPLIGKRTWGGVVGIWPRHSLVDGTVTTQPEFAFWFEDVGYGVENYGTDPDIEIENRPQDYAEGVDRQLDKALSTIRGILRKTPKKPNLQI